MFKKYFDKRIYLIPIKNGAKHPNPDAAGFNVWAEDGYDEDVATSFENRHAGKCGYGILMGKANNIVCVDGDTNHPDIIESLPYSPIRVMGNKARFGKLFFKYNGTLKNTKFEVNVGKQKLHGVDILVERKYAIIPPSVHELGYPYIYENEKNTFETIDIELLPDLHESDLVRIQAAVAKVQSELDPETTTSKFKRLESRKDNTQIKSPHGSHDQLKRLASILIFKKTPINKAISEIIKFDKEYHQPIGHLSPENGHSDCSADYYSNASKFYTNILASVNAQRIKKGLDPEIPETSEISIEFKAPEKKQILVFKDLPKFDGMIANIQSEILRQSPAPQPSYALAGALGVMSVMCGGVYQTSDVWPSLFIMLTGRTGMGKDSSRKIVTKILKHEKLIKRNLLGLTEYASAPSLILTLPEQRIRLDVVDEFSSFLSNISGGNQFKRDASLELTKIWSINGGYYGGIKAVSRDKTGACFNPMISLMGLCQPETLISSASKDMLDSGFLPRFLVFHAEDKPPFNRDYVFADKGVDSLVDDLIKMFPNDDLLNIQGGVPLDIGTRKIIPKQLTTTPIVKNMLTDLAESLYDKQHEMKDDPVQLAFFGRAFEQILRILTLVVISRGRKEIQPEDIDISKELVECINFNSRALITEASAGSEYAKLFERLSNFIHKRGSVTFRDVSQKLRGIQLKMRNQLLEDLVSHGLIMKNPTKEEWFWI